MKEIQYTHFQNMVFIPAKSRFGEDKPYWHRISDLHGTDGTNSSTTQIILINCATPEEIPATIHKEIVMLERIRMEQPEEKETAEKQIELWTKLQKEILPESPLRKEPPKELIEFLDRNGFWGLRKEQVIYTSGIENLVES